MTDRQQQPQTDDSVPEGHKGLHTFLYGEGEGGAEGAHATAASSGSSGYVQFTRGTIHEVQEWLAKHDGAEGQPKVAGVYGVYDDFGGLVRGWVGGWVGSACMTTIRRRRPWGGWMGEWASTHTHTRTHIPNTNKNGMGSGTSAPPATWAWPFART